MESDILSMLSLSDRRGGAFKSASSFASVCHIPYRTVRMYLQADYIGAVADFYRYKYRIRRVLNDAPLRGRRKDSTGSFAYEMAAVYRGYGSE